MLHIFVIFVLTHEQMETHGYILGTVATDALIHQAIGIHSAYKIFIVLDQFHTETLQLWGIILMIKLHLEKNKYNCLKVSIGGATIFS